MPSRQGGVAYLRVIFNLKPRYCLACSCCLFLWLYVMVTVNEFNKLKLLPVSFSTLKSETLYLDWVSYKEENEGENRGKMAPKYSSRTLEWLNVFNWAAVYEPCSFSSVLVQHLSDFGRDLNRQLRDLAWQSHVGWEERQEKSDGDKKCSSTFKTH